jgi:hypothetical protein
MASHCRKPTPWLQALSGEFNQGKYIMTQNSKENPVIKQPQPAIKQQPKPNEAGVLNIDEHIRIFDPNTKETLVEKRI